ncbi:MAG: endonuclease/exonuclease/phosphatase [Bacteroidetes bacterium B1(2017)]|nr:MAG: endonuclease/exonuclease/phosphatase [Bacteroidetes bacterium B1(2017)]
MKKFGALVLVSVLFIAAKADTLSICTYNIRLDVSVDGVNQWGKRIDKVSEIMRQNESDFFCVQEALPNQIDDIQGFLPTYNYVGVGRDDGMRKGEFSAIFYKATAYDMLTNGTFWLSPTPSIPGSKGWDAAITRICTYAKFKSKSSGKIFWVFNTHFDHIGDTARQMSALLITKKMKEMAGDEPCLLTGDFNSEPTSSAYKTILSNTNHSLKDSYIAQTRDCTFTGFEVASDICKRIDFIFYDKAFKPKSFAIISKNNGTYYPSDHLPVRAVFSF